MMVDGTKRIMVALYKPIATRVAKGLLLVCNFPKQLIGFKHWAQTSLPSLTLPGTAIWQPYQWVRSFWWRNHHCTKRCFLKENVILWGFGNFLFTHPKVELLNRIVVAKRKCSLWNIITHTDINKHVFRSLWKLVDKTSPMLQGNAHILQDRDDFILFLQATRFEFCFEPLDTTLFE